MNHIRSYTTSYHITYHTIPYNTISYHISHNIISYHNISYRIISYHIISYHTISYYIILYHIISYHIISYHIISYHIISYIISYLILSCHASYPNQGYCGRGDRGAIPLFFQNCRISGNFNVALEKFRTFAVGKGKGFEFCRKIFEFVPLPYFTGVSRCL